MPTRQGLSLRILRGTFVSGGVRLRSHVEFRLTSSAVLRGAAEVASYVPDERVPYPWINRSLLFAEDCEHVAVSGSGVIDGGGIQFGTAEGNVRPVAVRMRSPTSSG